MTENDREDQKTKGVPRSVLDRIGGLAWLVPALILAVVIGRGAWFLAGLSDDSPPDREALEKSIDLAAAYLAGAVDGDGRMEYLVSLDPAVRPRGGYNMLRHSGAIYAMRQYLDRRESTEVEDAAVRAAGYLRRTAIRPVKGHEDILAVYTLPAITGESRVKLKLGGAGLGLAALCGLEAHRPGTTPLEDLKRLGEFILFMQKPGGGFHSRYFPDEGVFDREWTSLYYPGEAALGLVMLHQLDPDPRWIEAAADIIGYLARTREDRFLTEPDHWALIATGKILPLHDRVESAVPAQMVIDHAKKVSMSIMAPKIGTYAFSIEPRGLTPNMLTCPTSARLEGLIAAMDYLPEENAWLRGRMEDSIMQGARMLVGAQVKDGPRAGAIPWAARTFPGARLLNKTVRQRAEEVRIDYVQHALSAMLGAAKMMDEKDERRKN